jgi:hypothetical protein
MTTTTNALCGVVKRREESEGMTCIRASSTT